VQAKHYERAELLPEKRAALKLWHAEILRVIGENHGS
jgi:hypothetical protein